MLFLRFNSNIWVRNASGESATLETLLSLRIYSYFGTSSKTQTLSERLIGKIEEDVAASNGAVFLESKVILVLW